MKQNFDYFLFYFNGYIMQLKLSLTSVLKIVSVFGISLWGVFIFVSSILFYFKWTVVLGWIVSTGVCLAVLFTIAISYREGNSLQPHAYISLLKLLLQRLHPRSYFCWILRRPSQTGVVVGIGLDSFRLHKWLRRTCQCNTFLEVFWSTRRANIWSLFDPLGRHWSGEWNEKNCLVR